jgi:tRNA(Glu) U13 pseudouridine synthase TruD
MHGYQSLVWNRMAALRSAFSSDVMEGDLVALGAGGGGLDAWEERAARPSALHTQAEQPGATQGRWNVHYVTAQEAASKRFQLAHVVLPIPGAAVLYPQHEVGLAYMKHLWQDQTHLVLWPTAAAGLRLQRLSVTQRESIAAACTTAVSVIANNGHAGTARQELTAATAAANASAPSSCGAAVHEVSFGDVSIPEEAILGAAQLEALHGPMCDSFAELPVRHASKVSAETDLPRWLLAASKGGYRHLLVTPANTCLWHGPIPSVEHTPSIPQDIQTGQQQSQEGSTQELAAIASFSLPPGSYATVLLSALTGGGARETSVKR